MFLKFLVVGVSGKSFLNVVIFTVFVDVCPETKESIFFFWGGGGVGEAGAWCLPSGSSRGEVVRTVGAARAYWQTFVDGW